MGWVEKGDQRRNTAGGPADRQVAPLAKPTGQPSPSTSTNPTVAVGDPDHPARLRAGDLENPDQFHSRLKAWLLQQTAQP